MCLWPLGTDYCSCFCAPGASVLPTPSRTMIAKRRRTHSILKNGLYLRIIQRACVFWLSPNATCGAQLALARARAASAFRPCTQRLKCREEITLYTDGAVQSLRLIAPSAWGSKVSTARLIQLAAANTMKPTPTFSDHRTECLTVGVFPIAMNASLQSAFNQSCCSYAGTQLSGAQQTALLLPSLMVGYSDKHTWASPQRNVQHTHRLMARGSARPNRHNLAGP